MLNVQKKVNERTLPNGALDGMKIQIAFKGNWSCNGSGNIDIKVINMTVREGSENKETIKNRGEGKAAGRWRKINSKLPKRQGRRWAAVNYELLMAHTNKALCRHSQKIPQKQNKLHNS